MSLERPIEEHLELRNPSRGAGSRLARLSAMAVVSGLVLSACGNGDDDGDADSAPDSAEDVQPAVDATLNTVMYSDPSSFDPALAAGQQSFQMASLLYDTVLKRDGADGLTGGLASEWEVIDADHYEFTIRDDAYCADGTEISASVVADSLNYLADPETGSTWRNLVFGLGDAEITADDESNVVAIELSEPFTTLEQGLTIAQTGIICPAGLEDTEALDAGDVEGAFSGPYVLEEADAGMNYTFSFREDYEQWPDWTELPVGMPAGTIEVAIGTDESTIANQLLAGDIDFGQFQVPSAIDRFEGNDDYDITEIVNATTYVVFNQRPGRIFSDEEGGAELREGVAHAINQDAFNTVFSDERGELLTTVVASSFPYANTDESLLTQHDSDAAAELLDGAGPIQMYGNTANAQYSGGADYIYEVLTSAGADVNIDQLDNATFWSTLDEADSDWDLVFLGDLNSVGAISASLDRVIGPSVEDGGRNYSASENTEGEEALAEALAALDDDEREDAYARAQQSLFDRNDVVPLAANMQAYVMGPNTAIQIDGDIVDFSTIRYVD